MRMETTRLIRPNELAKMLGVSTVTLWKWRRDGILPEPMRIGPRFIGWERVVIHYWLKRRNKSKDKANKTVK
jgi:prophage regulatory protein